MYQRFCLLNEVERCARWNSSYSFSKLSMAYCGALIQFSMGNLRSKFKACVKSRGCIGCCSKPQVIVAVDEPTKGLKIQGKPVKRATVVEDNWSTSQEGMENSAFQSQRSISSVSNSNQNIDHQGRAGSSSYPAEFVNHGLLLWNQLRQQWVGDKKPQDHTKTQGPRLSWNPTYESLLGTSNPFPQPIPLEEMVDFLTHVWEQEGLYD